MCWTGTTQSSYPDPIYTEKQGEGSENDLCCSTQLAFPLRALFSIPSLIQWSVPWSGVPLLCTTGYTEHQTRQSVVGYSWRTCMRIHCGISAKCYLFLESETYLLRPFPPIWFWHCAWSYHNIYELISDSLSHFMLLSEHFGSCTRHFLGILLCYTCQRATAVHFSLSAVLLRNMVLKLQCEQLYKFSSLPLISH